jgi:excisionase family DNA binding protein
MRCDLLNTREAAVFLGISKPTLDCWRSQGNPHQPPHVKVGTKLVRYRREDLVAWLESRKTSEK